jgi:amino acid transporter
MGDKHGETGLTRELGLLGLVATGTCSMVGAGVNVVPVMVQRSVPGIGPWVLAAYALAVVPALLAALSYAMLSSAMPRAGGSYVFASRSLSPYLGFVASFSQWFGLSMAIGVVAYVLVPFLRDLASAVSWAGVAGALEHDAARVFVPMAFLWVFTAVNLLGAKVYQGTLVPLMFLMFLGGVVVIPVGLSFDHADFVEAVRLQDGVSVSLPAEARFEFGPYLAAAALLFSSYVGFDSIAQAGGEARRPERNLPVAIVITIVAVAAYYLAFTAAVYHAVPWSYIADEAVTTDLTAPGLLGYLLSPGWTVIIVAAAVVGLVNDLPAMILSVSRLVFGWAEDEIFPPALKAVNERYHTPHRAILVSALVATSSIVLSFAAGDFIVAIDLMVTAMMVNFLLMALSVLWLPRRNPELAHGMGFIRSRRAQIAIAGFAAVLLATLIVAQIVKDVSAPAPWYFHAFYLYVVVLAIGSLIFFERWSRLRERGVDLHARFSTLPKN